MHLLLVVITCNDVPVALPVCG